MTAGSLRDLAAKATPGPWAVMSGFSTKQVRTDDYHLAIVAETLRAAYPENAEGDARLIALAPDLAVLCADMADALDNAAEFCNCLPWGGSVPDGYRHRAFCPVDFAPRLLARFRALEAQTGQIA